ncbi:unnamed protein product [Closterium sp. NIES-53]
MTEVDMVFDKSVPFYRLFPYCSAPPPPLLLFRAPGPPPVDSLPPQGPAPSGVSQVDPLPGPVPVQVAIGSGAARGVASGGAESGGAELGGAESEGAETGGAEPGGVEPRGGDPGGTEPEGVEPGGAGSEGAESGGAEPQGSASSVGSAGASPRLSPQQLRERFVWRARLRSGASGARGTGAAGARGAGVAAGAGVTGATATTAGDPTESGATGAGGSGARGTGAGGAGVGGTSVGGAGVGGPGVGGAGAGGAGAVDPGGARQGVDYFQTFSPTPKMTTLRVLLHVAAHRDYELHSLDFSTAFLQGSLHEEIWLRHPPGFTETTLAALGFAPTTADPLLFLRPDTSLPPFNDLIFAIADTDAMTLVKLELQKRHICTDLGELRSYLGLQITRDGARRTITLTQSHMVHHVLQRFGFQFSSPQPTPLSTSHSLSAPLLDESVEPSGPYPELVGCLMYLMTCTRPDLAYPLSLLARYVAPGRHQKVHWDAAKRVLCYLCSTSGMGLVLGERGPVVLTGHADASWTTRSFSVLSSSCKAEMYAGAIAAQELRWLTYLLIDLQRGQLRLACVATRANTADIFTKALPPGDHQRFSTVLGLVPTLPHLLTALLCLYCDLYIYLHACTC